jgi:hypothetical protein
MTGHFALYRGCLAFVVTEHYRLPVKVTKVHEDGLVDVVVTAAHDDFEQGSEIKSLTAGQHVFTRTGVDSHGTVFEGYETRPIPDSVLDRTPAGPDSLAQEGS